MDCKNCSNTLRTDYSYCPDCGAKVIRNRITVKNLWFDIVDRYFNIDNTFLKTFFHLFTKPEIVIEGYLNGIRRKYLNPISYLGISITLSGFIVFLIKKKQELVDFDVFNTGVTSVAQERLLDQIFDYQSLLFILYIPIMAMSAWLCFQKKGYNFSERVVIFMYTLAHYSMFTFVPSVLLLLVYPEFYGLFGMFSLLTMYLYSAYVIKRISKEKGIEFWAKLLLFVVIFTIFYFGLILAIQILMIVLGAVSLEDFKPIKK